MGVLQEIEPACGRCKHFTFVRQGSAVRVGECRRSAPQPRTDGGPVSEASWPLVLETMSCGDFELIPESKSAEKEAKPVRADANADAVPSPRRRKKAAAKAKAG